MSAQQLGFLETLLGITTTVVNGKRTLLLCCRTFAAEYSFVSKQMTLYLIPSLAPLKSLESLQNVTHTLYTPDSLSCCSPAGAPRISGALTRARNGAPRTTASGTASGHSTSRRHRVPARRRSGGCGLSVRAAGRDRGPTSVSLMCKFTATKWVTPSQGETPCPRAWSSCWHCVATYPHRA